MAKRYPADFKKQVVEDYIFGTMDYSQVNGHESE